MQLPVLVYDWASGLNQTRVNKEIVKLSLSLSLDVILNKIYIELSILLYLASYKIP